MAESGPVEPGEPVAMARRLRTWFEQDLGRPPDVVARAPGRVNLIGEHTDYNAGLCLPLALPHATYVAAARRTDAVVRIHSAAFGTWTGAVGQLRTATGWAAYPAGVLWAVGHREGVDLAVASTVPVGAGLSSSAAIECAVAVAATALQGRSLDDPARAALVRAGVRAEAEVADAPTGGLDQTASLLATPGAATLVDFRDGSRRPVPLRLGADRLLVLDTRVRHDLADGGYAARRAECERAAEALGVPSLSEASPEAWRGLADPVLRARARHVSSENDRVRAAVRALEEGATARLGELLTASHHSLREDFGVSCAELDAAVEAAVSAGALGARLTGGGFGGSVVALVPGCRLDAVVEGVRAAFRDRGWPVPDQLDAGGGSPPAGVL